MKKSLVGLVAVAALLPLLAGAIEIKTQAGNGGTALTSKGNLYGAGGTVMVATTTLGDVYAAGGTIVLNGDTAKDVVTAGGTISVNGKVGDDLRAVGGNIIVGSSVAGDLVAAGGQVEVNKSSAIGGDVLVAAGNVRIDGAVAGSVNIAGGTVFINGPIAKDLEIRANKLEFGSGAVASGSIKYFGPQEAVVDQGAKVSNISYVRTEQRNRNPWAAAAGVSWLTGFLAVSALALLLYFLFDRKDREAIRNSPFWKEVVRGLVLLVVVPVAIFICFITFIGWMIALSGLLLYVLSIILALGYVGILAARLLNQWLIKRKFEWWMILLGVLAVQIMVLIPFLGWIAYLILFLASFGTLMNGIYMAARNR